MENSKVLSKPLLYKKCQNFYNNSNGNCESFDFFISIFENNPLPMGINSVEEKKILKANSAFLEKTGYSEEDVIGKNKVFI